MSLLERLRIHGIRSFGTGPEDYGEIKFSTPLTLILGQNGCGKTTIIESLKYAICANEPPNARCGAGGGSAFVHDPKLDKAIESIAQIKLKIRDIKKKKTTVVRSMKNIQKQKKQEFKTLDNTITTENDYGKEEMISNRCVDVNVHMCYLMGVSKPILNYVIFCHQEESNWPLEEGKKVKERFDEIFDSVKYNQCLEKIRTIRKNLASGNKLLAKDVEILKMNKDTADKSARKLRDEESRLAANNETINSCLRDLTVVDEKMDVVRNKEMNIANLAGEMRANKIKLEELRKTIEETMTGLPGGEFRGTDKELEESIKSFELEFGKKKEKLVNIETQLRDAEDSEKHWQKKLNEEQGKLGGLKRDHELYKETIQHRNESVNRVASKLHLQESTQYSESSFDNTIEEVEKKLREMRRDIEALKTEFDSQEKSLQEGIDSLRVEEAKLDQITKTKKAQLVETKRDVQKVKSQIDEVDKSTATLITLENRLKRVKRDIESESQTVNLPELEKELKELQSNRDRMEEELGEISEEIDVLIETSKLQASLDSYTDRKAACDSEIERLKSRNEDSLKHLLTDVPQTNVKQNLDLCIARLTDNIQSSQRQIAAKQRELTRLESKQHHLEEKLRTANQTLIADEDELDNMCGSKNYDRTVSEVTDQLKEFQEETGKLKSSSFVYRRYIEKLQQPRPCCPLCTRQFDAEREAIELAEQLEHKLKDIPTLLATKMEDQNKYQDKLNRLQQLKPVNDRISLLRDTEIPSFSEELEKVKKQVKEMKEDLIGMDNELALGPQSDESLARSIQEDVMLLDQNTTEARRLQREIDDLQPKIPTTVRTLQLAKNEKEQLQSKLNSMRKTFDSKQSMKGAHVDRMNKLQTEQNDIVKDQLRVQSGVQQKKQLLDKQNELKELEITLTDEIEKSFSEIFPVKQKLESAIRKKEEVKKTNLEEIDKENTKVTAIKHEYEEVRKLHSKVLQFERREIVSKLTDTEKNMSQIRRDLDGLAEKKVSLQAQKDTAKADITNESARHRDLNDNKKLRQKRTDEVVLSRKVREMTESLGELNYESVRAEVAALEKQAETLKNKKHQAQGTQRELEMKIKELRHELGKKDYKDAGQRYKEKFIEWKVDETTFQDLGSYYLAMDWALRQFHSEKMKTINVIIRELWRKIYVGNDIDYIEIKTSEEQSASADKKRVYNYRVVQIKNDVELDMRGRCSAGQKVLASLIIRMALAETFSHNCGIMTLDEPTTNLDRDNIQSLCSALINIVESRTRQKNFQMVVITHDEDFLTRLTREEKVQHYWRVYRNEWGLSRIEKNDAY